MTKWTDAEQLAALYGDVEFTVAELPYPELHGGSSGGESSSLPVRALPLRTFLKSVMSNQSASAGIRMASLNNDDDSTPVKKTGKEPEKGQDNGKEQAKGKGTGQEKSAQETKYLYIFAPVEPTHPMAKDILLPGAPLKYFDAGNSMVQDGASDGSRGVFEVYIGREGSGAQPHHHAAAWNGLLRGKKRWFLWPHACQAYGYEEHYGVPVRVWAERV